MKLKAVTLVATALLVAAGLAFTPTAGHADTPTSSRSTQTLARVERLTPGSPTVELVAETETLPAEHLGASSITPAEEERWLPVAAWAARLIGMATKHIVSNLGVARAAAHQAAKKFAEHCARGITLGDVSYHKIKGIIDMIPLIPQHFKAAGVVSHLLARCLAGR